MFVVWISKVWQVKGIKNSLLFINFQEMYFLVRYFCANINNWSGHFQRNKFPQFFMVWEKFLFLFFHCVLCIYIEFKRTYFCIAYLQLLSSLQSSAKLWQVGISGPSGRWAHCGCIFSFATVQSFLFSSFVL